MEDQIYKEEFTDLTIHFFHIGYISFQWMFHVLKDIFVTQTIFLILYVCVLQVFLIIHYQPLVNTLADVILNGDLSVFTPQTDIHSTHKSMVTHTHRKT